MASFIYRHPLVYQAVMRLLYGKSFQERYRQIAGEIAAGSSVADVCAGDCYLYRRYLKSKRVDYLGLDLSPQMVQFAEDNGVAARLFNLWQDELPRRDVLVIQGSLCQFLPRAEEALGKLLEAARQKVIVAEPIRNWSDSSNRILATAGRLMTQPHESGENYAALRFNQKSLSELFGRFAAFERAWVIPGGREMIGIFRGCAKN